MTTVRVAAPLPTRNQPASIRQFNLIRRHRRPGDVSIILIDVEGEARIVQAMADMTPIGETAHFPDRVPLRLERIYHALERAPRTPRHIGHRPGCRLDDAAAGLDYPVL